MGRRDEEAQQDLYRDDADLKKYRTEIPNMIYDINLTPYEGWLYGHIKRVCGARPGGKCTKSVKTLARETGMSTGRVSEARASLAKQGLIRIDQPAGVGTRKIVTVVDIWMENMRRYTSFATLHNMNPPSPDEDPPSGNPSPHEPKKEQKKELDKNSAKRRLAQMREVFGDRD